MPVHTAHDRASLEDLLDLLSGKSMVLIDTAGMAQRDSRTRELLEMLSHRAIKRLLVVNASAQGETIEDAARGLRRAELPRRHAVQARRGGEAGPGARRGDPPQAQGLAVANGQRVPEDWHRLSASALVQTRAARAAAAAAWRLDSERREPDLRRRAACRRPSVAAHA